MSTAPDFVEDPQLQKIRALHEHMLGHQARVIGMVGGYNQVMVLGGYAAFFAVWSAMTDRIPNWAVLSSGGLITVSVIIYVGWTVLGMFMTQSATANIMAALSMGPDGFLQRTAKVEADAGLAQQKIMRWWKVILFAAGSPALLGAGILAGTSLIVVAGKAITAACR